MERNQIRALDAVSAAIDRIAATDDRLRAWVEVDGAGAAVAATRLEADDRSLPLRGVVFGVKDVIDVAGLRTQLGAPSFAHYAPERDATAVAKLRAAGAIPLGKTATTAFAHRDPPPTRNPWNLEHTPGGSSSGSGAAVGAGVLPLALGTQTIGSTLRPAGFCGVVGLKATHGRVSAKGVFPLAPSFDHVGIIAANVGTAARALNAIAGYDADDPFSLDTPVEDYVAALQNQRPPRVAVARSDYLALASEEVGRHVDSVVDKLVAAGAVVTEVALPLDSQSVLDLGYPVFRAEAAVVHAEMFARYADAYPPNMRALIEAGQKTPATDYARGRLELRQLRRALDALIGDYDVLLMPVCPTTAPRGLDQTGSAVFCAPASFTGLPSIALPSGVSDAGLPFAIQLVGQSLSESALLRTAAWIEEVLGFSARPSL